MKLLAILVLTLPLIAGELHDAVASLNNHKIAALLEQGVDINATNEKGETALHIASRIGRLSIVRLLLEYSPDLYSENEAGYTPLAVAIGRNHIKTIKLLLDAQRSSRYIPKLGYIHTVVETGNVAAVEALIDQGYDVDSVDGEGVTLLHLAAKRGDGAMVEMLVRNGADAGKVDNEGRDSLYYARYGRNQAIIKKITDMRK